MTIDYMSEITKQLTRLNIPNEPQLLVKWNDIINNSYTKQVNFKIISGKYTCKIEYYSISSQKNIGSKIYSNKYFN